MDYLMPESMNEEQIQFLITRLARNPNALLETQAEFERFYHTKINGLVIQNLLSERKEEVTKLRNSIYQDEVANIPLAHSYTILAIAQSRIEDLLKNPKVVRTVKKSDDNTGKDYWQAIEEIDDKMIQMYLKISQDERFFSIRCELEKIIKDVDKHRLPKTGFKPIQINTGFEIDEKEQINT